jgi:hypothetical protein
MHRDQFMVVVDAHRARGDLQPQLLADELKRRRVVAVLELNVAIAVELGLGPPGTLVRSPAGAVASPARSG